MTVDDFASSDYVFDAADWNHTRIWGHNLTVSKKLFGFFKPRQIFNGVDICFKHVNGTVDNIISLLTPNPSGAISLVGCVI